MNGPCHDANHEPARMGCSNLGLDDRNCHGQEANTNTLNGASGNEDVEARSEHLHKCCEEVDECADADALLSPDHVSEPSSNEGAYSCSNL